MIALGLLGAFCGHHSASRIILFPSWVGGLLGLFFALLCSTLRSGRGDLARAMGAKVVAFVETVFDINEDLHVAGKLSSCIGVVVSKCLVFDRKHKVKDKLSSAMGWVGGKVGGVVGGMKGEWEEGNVTEERERR